MSCILIVSKNDLKYSKMKWCISPAFDIMDMENYVRNRCFTMANTNENKRYIMRRVKMYSYKDRFQTYNEPIQLKYSQSIDMLNQMKEKLKEDENIPKSYKEYFYHAETILSGLNELEKKLNDQYFQKEFEELLEENYQLFQDFREENYETGFANPRYSASLFGEDLGKILASYFASLYEGVKFAYHHKVFLLYALNKKLIEIFQIFTEEEKCSNQEIIQKINQIISNWEFNDLRKKIRIQLQEKFDPNFSYYEDLILHSDLTDLRYLFQYGKYISENEINMAKYLNTLEDEFLRKLAEVYTEGFRKGFIRDNKDLSKKSVVQIRYHIGFEAIIKKAIKNFHEMGLKVIVNDPETTGLNRQFYYDHRFDYGIYFNEPFIKEKEKIFEEEAVKLGAVLKEYAGPAVMETFGEKQFKPEHKSEVISLSPRQSKWMTKHQGLLQKIQSTYIPRSEYSFTIISFPIPDIGEKFPEIFEKTCQVNMIDSDHYEKIQQKIIDVLDEGEYVHIKGKKGNHTDMTVKLHVIHNPGKETNFENCVADVNIPVGEVFTSPMLKGTNGVLHVEDVYLNQLHYDNLELTFQDGYITKYQCRNFEKEEENKKFIEENLLFPHETLPLGEFAIGTNTTAYVMANEYDIVNVLPILIVEKMGPHFAIGDTCYSWSEDVPLYNPLNNKEIIAKDNEKSILRKENVQKAYTQKHIDITLPYHGIRWIEVLHKDGKKVRILEDGRFVLPGTEELNEAFHKE